MGGPTFAPPVGHPAFFSFRERSQAESLFDLSGTAAEWLFHTGMWARLRARIGVAFDQYEEIVVPADQLKMVIDEVDAQITLLNVQNDDVIVFEYGWSASGRFYHITTNRSELIVELAQLKVFLVGALQQDQPVEFGL